MDSPARSARIAIVGAGRLGAALGVALHRAHYEVVSCFSRMRASAEQLALSVPGLAIANSAGEAAILADIVFLTVPDDAIAAVQSDIRWTDQQLAVHCSGALPASALEAATRAGARVAGFHPLQTFSDPASGPENLPGSRIGIEADDATWPTLATLARDLGAVPLRIAEADRPLYHAASVLVSNGTVGLMALGVRLWETVGFERSEAVRALAPLLEGTLRNIRNVGVPAALTGPVVRGDLGTVTRHLGALANAPQELALYRAVSAWLIELAQERGTITAGQAAALRSIIEGHAAPE